MALDTVPLRRERGARHLDLGNPEGKAEGALRGQRPKPRKGSFPGLAQQCARAQRGAGSQWDLESAWCTGGALDGEPRRPILVQPRPEPAVSLGRVLWPPWLLQTGGN